MNNSHKLVEFITCFMYAAVTRFRNHPEESDTDPICQTFLHGLSLTQKHIKSTRISINMQITAAIIIMPGT